MSPVLKWGALFAVTLLAAVALAATIQVNCAVLLCKRSADGRVSCDCPDGGRIMLDGGALPRVDGGSARAPLALR
jgi:hypothetical protein